MRLNDFATLQRGEVIEVKTHYVPGAIRRCGFKVFTVCSEPREGNTLIDAIGEDGKTYGIYFRDVIQRRKVS